MIIPDNKKNVLFFGCWPPPFGGIASHLYQLLPDLVYAGLNVHLCVNNETGKKSRIKDKGVEIIYYSHKFIFKKHPFRLIFLFFRFFPLKKDLTIREFIIQICHYILISDTIKYNAIEYLFTHDNPRHLVVPFIRAGFPMLKIFATIYADFFISPNKYYSKREFLMSCFKSSDLVLSCSNFCCDSGTKFLGINYPQKVIYNNVNPNIFSPLNEGAGIRVKHNIPTNSIVLFTMCKMNEDMGIKFLIDFHEEILSLDSKIVLFFVGAADNLSEAIVELSKKNSRIFHAFNIPNNKKHLYFASGDIFTAPTIGSHACMGIANIEAMMSGIPVLSSDSGGHRETIDHEHDGFLVPLDNGEINKNLYLQYLNELLKNPNLREEIGIRTRRRALALFSNDRIVEAHIEIMKGNY